MVLLLLLLLQTSHRVVHGVTGLWVLQAAGVYDLHPEPVKLRVAQRHLKFK
jgi:hypothetical protein